MEQGPIRYSALDSCRGLCALAVAAFHFPMRAAIPLIENAYLFVDFFFVLSGFVMAKAYGGLAPRQAPKFLLRRIGRIWPLHVTILAVFVMVSVVQGDLGSDERHSVFAIWTNLAMIHGLGLHSDLTWNGPSWSISVEFILYLLFALTGAMAGRKLLMGVAIVAALCGLVFVAPSGMASTHDYGMLRGIAGFFAGVLVADLRGRQWGSLMEAAAAISVVLFVSSGVAQWLAPVVFGAAVYVFSASRGVIGSFLTTKPLVTLGTWSYSVYMVHAAVVAAISILAQAAGVVPQVWWTIPYLAVTVAVSAITYRWIEAPARAWFYALPVRSPVVAATR